MTTAKPGPGPIDAAKHPAHETPAPPHSASVDPEDGTEPDGTPVENPSG